MTIKIVVGNLLDAFDKGEVDVIGHCCNMQNTFGSGIAKSIRERYPKAYEADTVWYKANIKHVPLSVATLPKESLFTAHNRRIFNLYGQEFYGVGKRQVHYGRLTMALLAMESWLEKGKTVGFPYKMACDRAGGDFTIVTEIIESIFHRYDVRFYKLEG